MILTDEELKQVRQTLNNAMPHTYTRVSTVPVLDQSGDPETDPWGNPVMEPAQAVVGLPCRYQTVNRFITDEQGQRIISASELIVPYTDTVTEDDEIRDVTTTSGQVIVLFAVADSINPHTEVGESLQKRVTLTSVKSVI
jgi:hypothetical protein